MRVMAFLTGEFPRTIPRAVWLTARARNAVRRPVFIGAVGIGTFVAALLGLVLAPQQVKHAGDSKPSDIGVRPDTTPFIAGLLQARSRLAHADSSLSLARVRVAAVPAHPVVDTLSPLLIKQRDSLSAAVNDLDALLTRVETAPVTASYRAPAQSPELTSNPRVRSLVDSLSDVERDRDAFGSTGGADPVYVALTTRSAEIGREIQDLAQHRREELRQQIARVNAPTQRQAIAETPAVDTAGWVAERDSAQSLVAQATAGLGDAREKAAEYDRALAAALILGVALGFGSAFIDEMRRPRISADEHEVERVTGARVLATITPRPKDPERSRRSADRLPP